MTRSCLCLSILSNLGNGWGGAVAPPQFISLLAMARKFIIMDIHESNANELLGFAAITLALGITYCLMLDRDDHASQLRGINGKSQAMHRLDA